MSDEQSIKVIDTEDALTKEELCELKRLAAMSKAARWVVAGIIGVLMFIGYDHAIEMLRRMWK